MRRRALPVVTPKTWASTCENVAAKNLKIAGRAVGQGAVAVSNRCIIRTAAAKADTGTRSSVPWNMA
jgi:hypothetical protein